MFYNIRIVYSFRMIFGKVLYKTKLYGIIKVGVVDLHKNGAQIMCNFTKKIKNVLKVKSKNIKI